jgi:hypothetical protein
MVRKKNFHPLEWNNIDMLMKLPITDLCSKAKV